MALWPFCPAPVFTESLEFYSDVIGAYSAEQRFGFPDSLRQFFTFQHPMSFRQYERAQLLMEGNAHLEWTLPGWQERQRFSVAQGVSIIPVDTTVADYREGGELILWRSDEVYEAHLIDAIADDAITIDGVTSRPYSNALVCPLLTARCLENGLEAPRTVQPAIAGSTAWEVCDTVDLADTSLYGTYRSHPVVDDSVRIGSGSFDIGVSRATDRVDFGLAAPYVDTLTDRVTRPLAMAWTISSASALWAARRFLHALRGRQKGIWMPTWTRGLQLVEPIDALDTTITILGVGFYGVAPAGDLMLKTYAGGTHFFRFTSVAQDGANELLTLSGAAGVAIAPSAVQTLCRMHFCRAKDDGVRLDHQHTGHGQVTSIVLPVLEVPIP